MYWFLITWIEGSKKLLSRLSIIVRFIEGADIALFSFL